MANVFISYSHVDASVADDLGTAVEAAGLEYFRDEKDIKWGAEIQDTVQAALEECNALLVIISPASLKSLWVPYEIGYFSALKRLTLPYVTHPSQDVPQFISNLKFVASVNDATKYLKSMKEQLLQPRKSTTAPRPDLRVHYSPVLIAIPNRKTVTAVGIIAQNRDVNSVFVSGFELLLDNGHRMPILRCPITGLPSPSGELRSGQKFEVYVTRDAFGTSLGPNNVIGVEVTDQVGRRYSGDPSRIRECIAELFRDDAGR